MYRRKYSSFWSGSTGRALRGHPCAQILADYLVTNDHVRPFPVGIYRVPAILIAHETGIPLEGASKGLWRGLEGVLKALERLSREGYAHYDFDAEYVWVPAMARYQIGEVLKPKDKRRGAVIRALTEHAKSPFMGDWMDLYGESYGVSWDDIGTDLKGLRRGFEGASKGLASPSEGASKGHRRGFEGASKPGTGTETGTETGEGRDSNPRTRVAHAREDPSKDVVFMIEGQYLSGPLKRRSDYHVTRDKLREWSESYPGVDIMQTLRDCRQWLIDSPSKRKTRARLPGWISSVWLSRRQDRGSKRSRGTPVRHGTVGADVWDI